MRLSVIIPAFEESEQMILRAVNSVKNQLAYDPEEVEIIIALDMPKRVLTIPGALTVSTDKNTGAGLARQRGVDAACGEYVMFLDADDIYYNALALNLIYSVIDSEHPDLIRFPILEERSDGNGYVQHGQDMTWVFSKVWRRQFLIDNNIRFGEYRVHEDSYFCRIFEMHRPKIIDHGDMIYLWANNPMSTVRNNDGIYWQLSFPVYIDVIYTLATKKGEMGISNVHDHIYNFAYCYALISRMDEEHAQASIDKLKEYLDAEDLKLLSISETGIANELKAVESLPNIPLRLPRFGYKEFLKKLER